jgi:hypothetical protein
MHDYSTDFINRTRVIFVLAAVAVSLFFITGFGLVVTDVRLPFWVGGLSSGLIFTVLFQLYDTVLWRRRPLGLRLSSIPDLNGTYTGRVTIRHGKESKEERCWLRISQTWTRISVEFHTPLTWSLSSMAVIDKDNPYVRGIRYEYHVAPRDGAMRTGDDPGRHSGLSEMRLERCRGKRVLRGEFYNNFLYNRHGEYAVRLRKPIEAADWLASLPIPSQRAPGSLAANNFVSDELRTPAPV